MLLYRNLDIIILMFVMYEQFLSFHSKKNIACFHYWLKKTRIGRQGIFLWNWLHVNVSKENIWGMFQNKCYLHSSLWKSCYMNSKPPCVISVISGEWYGSISCSQLHWPWYCVHYFCSVLVTLYTNMVGKRAENMIEIRAYIKVFVS